MFTLKKILRKLRFYFQSFLNLFRRGEIFLIPDENSWIIKTVTQEIAENLNKAKLAKVRLSLSPLFIKNKIIHFGSVHVFASHKNKVHLSNKIIVSWYHLNNRDIEKELAEEIKEKNITVHTSCSVTKEGLVKLGIKEEQIKVVPLGIDLKIFKPLKNPSEKTEIKKRLGLPLDKITIGSFQKDGNGWEDGLEPKLVKGPDIFCDTVELLSKKYPLHVLLSGPSRGYVKNRLSQSNIPFTHKFSKKYNDIADFYHALDLYLITSRTEGGPMALLESWATGTPLVSTSVGMVKDLGKENENILIAESENIEEISAQAEKILKDKSLSEKIVRNALLEVKNYSWRIMADRCFQKFYL
ncbi:MAG: glycosyltransferase family 4 protein [Candidatus Paceibacterota bacterium]